MANFFDQFDSPKAAGNFFDQFEGGLDQYDTKLSPQEEAQFQAWKNQYAPQDSGADYDLRGAFKAGLTPDPKTNHWPDTFKKPNHETFSNESKYAQIPYAAASKAGSWNGEQFTPAQAPQTQQASSNPSPVYNMARGGVGGIADTLDFINYLNPLRVGNNAVRALTGQKPLETIRESWAKSGATYNSPEELPKEDRPFANAAETVAGALGLGVPGVGALKAAQPVAKYGPKVIERMANFASRAPVTAAAAEAVAAGGAGQGAFLAETFDPGNPLTRAAAEVGGGIASPASLAVRVRKLLPGSNSKWLPPFTRSAAEDRAAESMQAHLRAAGENPEDLARILDTADPDKLALTSAQRTGSQALLDFEASLAAHVPEAGADAARKKVAALADLRDAAEALTVVGDPKALRSAANLRKKYFADLLSGRVSAAREQAETARKAVEGGGIEAQRAASVRATNALQTAMDDARSVEHSLWENIPFDSPASGDGIVSAAKQIKDERLLPVQDIPGPVGQMLKRMASKGEEATTIEFPDERTVSMGGPEFKLNSGHVKILRSIAGEESAKAYAAGDRTLGSVFGKIHEAATKQLEGLPGFEEANAYTKAMHEAFDAPGITKAIQERVPPETMMDTAFSSGGNKGQLNLETMRRATEFPEGSAAPGQMRAAQEQYVRARAGMQADPTTGAVTPRKADTFLRSNPAVESQFPGVAANLERAAVAETDLASAIASESTRMKKVNNTLQNVLGMESPTAAVGKVLDGDNPYKEFAGLARMASKAGDNAQDAVFGLRSAALQNAIAKSFKPNGDFSFKTLRKLFMEPAKKGDKPLTVILRQTGVADEATVSRMRDLASRGAALEDQIGDAAKAGKIMPVTDQFTDFVVRLLGSYAARVAERALPGNRNSIQIPTAGAQVARRLFEKMPAARTASVLVEAMNDPKLAASLLRRSGKDAVKTRENEQQLRAFIARAGIDLGEDDGQ